MQSEAKKRKRGWMDGWMRRAKVESHRSTHSVLNETFIVKSRVSKVVVSSVPLPRDATLSARRSVKCTSFRLRCSVPRDASSTDARNFQNLDEKNECNRSIETFSMRGNHRSGFRCVAGFHRLNFRESIDRSIDDVWFGLVLRRRVVID